MITKRVGRVVVADDDPDIRDILVLNLEDRGFQVESADKGEAAWALVRAAHADLIVLDVMMPERDGLDVLASLKAHLDTRDVPVVLGDGQGHRRRDLGGLAGGR